MDTLDTKDWVAEFAATGVAVLRGCFSPAWLRRLDVAVDALIERAARDAARPGGCHDVARVDTPVGARVIRVNELFRHDAALAAILGHPELLAAVGALFDGPVLPVYESLLIKHPGDGMAVDWHRDMLRAPADRVVTVGVYLDDSTEAGGALRVIPGSQHASGDVCAVTRSWREAGGEDRVVTAQAGDVVFHDVMAVHSSPASLGPARRRTVYFEFRSVAHLRANPRYPDVWLERRAELMRHAHRHGAAVDAGDGGLGADDDGGLFARLYALPVVAEPGQYCLRHDKRAS